MTNRKQIVGVNMPDEVFLESLEALETHQPLPVITLAISLSTDDMSVDMRTLYRGIRRLADELGVDYKTTLTGKWHEAGPQLTLKPMDIPQMDIPQMDMFGGDDVADKLEKEMGWA